MHFDGARQPSPLILERFQTATNVLDNRSLWENVVNGKLFKTQKHGALLYAVVLRQLQACVIDKRTPELERFQLAEAWLFPTRTMSDMAYHERGETSGAALANASGTFSLRKLTN